MVAGQVRLAARIADIAELAELRRTHTAPLVHMVETLVTELSLATQVGKFDQPERLL